MTDTSTGSRPERNWKYWTTPLFVDVDGIQTAYRRGGSGETVLYLHGGGGTREWGPLHQAFAKRFDLIAPEHPGYGDTPRHPDQDTFADFVLHYDAFLRALDVERVHLVGTSLGAWIAANLAVFYPERFASVTLVTPLGARIEDEPFIDLFRFTYEEEPAALFNGRQDRYAEEFQQEGELDDLVRGIAEDATAALLFFNPRYDYKLDRRLQRVRVPSLVIGVDDDRVVGNLQAPRFAELLPNSEFLTISGTPEEPSGHGVVFEQPEDVAAAVAEHAVARAASVPA